MLESFLFLFTGVLGLVTIILMISSYRSNPFYNAYLLLIFTLISLRFLIHGSFILEIQTIFKPDHGLYSLLYLVIAPCFYLYYKNLVQEKNQYHFKDLKHLLFIGFLFIVNTNKTLQESVTIYFGRLYNFIFIGIFFLYYLILAFRLLSNTLWFPKKKAIHNAYFNLLKRWTIFLYPINVLGIIMLLISIYNESLLPFGITGKSMAFFLLCFWLFIYFKILSSPEILYGLPFLNNKLKTFNESLNKKEFTNSGNWLLETQRKKSTQDLKLEKKIESNFIHYTKEIDRLCFDEFIFRNPKIGIHDLANRLEVPKSHIVYMFKYHCNVSFSEYRMQSRIQDAINLIKLGFLQMNTYDSLAHKTGFSSYNPFFIGFKRVTFVSPQEYLKDKKNRG